MVEDFKCPYDTCENYLRRPICQNHAHIYCEDYKQEREISKFLERVRQNENNDWIEQDRINRLKHDYE